MPAPTVWDHLLLAALAVMPVLTARQWPHVAAYLRDPHTPPGARVPLYVESCVMLWGLAATVAFLWWWHDRPWGALGLVGGNGAGPLALTVAGCLAVLALSPLALRFRDRRWARGLLLDVHGQEGVVLPRTPAEHRAFRWASWTAGATEELVFRGWLLWYLETWLPTAGSIALGAAVFAGAHAYQGRRGLVKVFALGALFGTLMRVGGSLWPLVLTHALLDLQAAREGARLRALSG